ncbi:sulfotransferase ssu-1-like [Ornithodoros turicata]|uniref:sulfotransferase ssu-1-like n=1 Tax=Ornithodoros turicata TaxID=34597 RepID=UPI003138ACA9
MSTNAKKSDSTATAEKDQKKAGDAQQKPSSSSQQQPSDDSSKRKEPDKQSKYRVMYTAKDPRYPTYVIIDKLYLPMDVDVKSFSFAVSYRPSKDDIIVISYPKCGGVWVAQIVYLLLNNCIPLQDGDSFSRAVPVLEQEGQTLIKDRGGDREPKVVRTHLPYHKMRINPMAKYIYITRNPKDSCVALYDYILANTTVFRFKDGNFDNFFEWFIRGKVCYNDYFAHIVPYWLHRKDCHVLFCTYENMTLDHKSHIIMIANFIGGVAGTMVRERHMLKRLISRSSFAFMYKMYRDHAQLGNMSRGRIGEWKNWMTPAQASRVDQEFHKRFGTSEIANLWRYIVRFPKPEEK